MPYFIPWCDLYMCIHYNVLLESGWAMRFWYTVSLGSYQYAQTIKLWMVPTQNKNLNTSCCNRLLIASNYERLFGDDCNFCRLFYNSDRRVNVITYLPAVPSFVDTKKDIVKLIKNYIIYRGVTDGMYMFLRSSCIKKRQNFIKKDRFDRAVTQYIRALDNFKDDAKLTKHNL